MHVNSPSVGRRIVQPCLENSHPVIQQNAPSLNETQISVLLPLGSAKKVVLDPQIFKTFPKEHALKPFNCIGL